MDKLKADIVNEIMAGVRRSARLLPVEEAETQQITPLAVRIRVKPPGMGGPRYFLVRVSELL